MLNLFLYKGNYFAKFSDTTLTSLQKKIYNKLVIKQLMI